MVRTTALVIVVCGLNVRDVELGGTDVSDEVGVNEDSEEDVEEDSELDEVLSREVVEEGDVVEEEDVVDGGSEVEEGSVDVGSRLVVLGGSLVEVGGVSLSAQISEPKLSDGSAGRTRRLAVQTWAERFRSTRRCLGRLKKSSLELAWAKEPRLSEKHPAKRERDLPQGWEHLLWGLQLDGSSSLQGVSGEAEPVAGILGGPVDQRPWFGIAD